MKAPGPGDPETIGPYRVVAELGRGGMGRVWLADAPDGTLVAVKQVREQFVDDDGFRVRFRREVDASRKVSGAYTAAVLDADPDAPTPWLASAFVPGPSLRDVLDEAGPLTGDAAMRLAAGLATALTDIHRAGLVHRDLKPSNVLITADGPRVIDFGIARATDSAGGTEVTHTGWLVGAPGFMSPEQAEGRPVTGASDVFALGTVLIVACTGANPFDGPSTPQTLYNIVYAAPDLDALPEGIRPIVERCLAKDPEARPTADEVLAGIAEAAPAAPWPDPVRQAIERQDAEVGRLVAEARERTVLLGAAGPAPSHQTLVDPDAEPPIDGDAPTTVRAGAPGEATPASAPPGDTTPASAPPGDPAPASAPPGDAVPGPVSVGAPGGEVPGAAGAPASGVPGQSSGPPGETGEPGGGAAWRESCGATTPGVGPYGAGGPPAPPPTRGGRVGLIVAAVVIGLVVFCLGGTAVVGYVVSGDESSSGSGYETSAAGEPSEEPSDSYGASPSEDPESDSPSPSPTARDPDTLDDESTDDLDLTTDSVLPNYIDDYELAAASDDHSGCLDSGDDATQELMGRHGCGRMVTGNYLDRDNGLMASAMVIPLSTADDADAVSATLKKRGDAFNGLQYFCPHEGTGSSLCDSGTNGQMWVFYPSYHRYLIVVTIMRLDGGDAADDSATDALGRGVIDGIEEQMLEL